MTNYNFDDALGDVFEMTFGVTADQHLKNSFAMYGIEGTEQKIKEITEGKLQEFMLARYRKLINGKAQETKT